MKASELTGALLDYWVARAEGYADAGAGRRPPDHSVCVRRVSEDGPLCCLIYNSKKPAGYTPVDDFFQPSNDWARGGPIIERERISLQTVVLVNSEVESTDWNAWHDDLPEAEGIDGPTPLVAAMRAYVASKFGEEMPGGVGVA